MRYTKYIESSLSILIFSLFLGYMFQVEQPSTSSIIMVLSADLLIKMSFIIYSTRLISRGKIVLIKQKNSFWMKLLNVLLFVMILYASIFSFSALESSITNKIAIIFPCYIGLSSLFLLGKRGDFYIDRLGIIQPELLKRNYKWSEIENFRIADDSIKFELNRKDYNIQITEKVKLQLRNLKINCAQQH